MLGGARERALSGMLRNLSGKGLRLVLKERLTVNTMIRIDAGAAIYLGDVCYCFEENGEWQTGVQVAHSIRTNTSLRNLADQLTAESTTVAKKVVKES